jgi:hypothetical protein
MSSIVVTVHSPSATDVPPHVAIPVSPLIHVDYFSSKTFGEWLSSKRNAFHFKNANHTYKVNDVVVLVLDKRCVVGVAVIGGACRPATHDDETIYTEDDSQYNAYVMPLKACRLLPEPFPFEEIRHFCGIPEADTTSTNIWKGRPGRGVLYYGAAGAPSLYVERYKMLVRSWMP